MQIILLANLEQTLFFFLLLLAQAVTYIHGPCHVKTRTFAESFLHRTVKTREH